MHAAFRFFFKQEEQTITVLALYTEFDLEKFARDIFHFLYNLSEAQIN